MDPDKMIVAVTLQAFRTIFTKTTANAIPPDEQVILYLTRAAFERGDFGPYEDYAITGVRLIPPVTCEGIGEDAREGGRDGQAVSAHAPRPAPGAG